MPIASYQFINILSTMKFKSLDELTKSEETLIIICIRHIMLFYVVAIAVAVIIAVKYCPQFNRSVALAVVILAAMCMYYFQPLLLNLQPCLLQSALHPIDTQS